MSQPFKVTISSYCLDGKYYTTDGRRVTKATPGAVKVTRQSADWYGKIQSADGTRRKVNLGPSKTMAAKILAKLVTDATLDRHGLADQAAANNRLPIERHLGDFEQHLEATINARGHKNTPRHVEATIRQIRELTVGCGFRALREIAPGPIEALLATRQARGRRQVISARTRNGYLGALKQFIRWLIDEDRIARNPLTRLKKQNLENDQRHKRRAFGDNELPWLFKAALESSEVLGGLVGADRLALYATALGTGFRVRELASLAPSNFDLEKAVVKVSGEFTKDRRPIRNRPIPRNLADHLRIHLAGRAAELPIWPGTWQRRASDMIRHDMDVGREKWIHSADSVDDAVARRGDPHFLLYVDVDREFADFHALRHTFITRIIADGTSTKTAMLLSRHKDPKLTLGTYAHAEWESLKEAVNRLPTIESSSLSSRSSE